MRVNYSLTTVKHSFLLARISSKSSSCGARYQPFLGHPLVQDLHSHLLHQNHIPMEVRGIWWQALFGSASFLACFYMTTTRGAATPSQPKGTTS